MENKDNIVVEDTDNLALANAAVPIEPTTAAETAAPASTEPSANPTVQMLHDMFPSVERKVVEALLIASGGNVEAATNAMLYLSDPSCGIEIPTATESTQPPAVPTRPSAEEVERRKQMQKDEELARKLARSYDRPRRTQQQQQQYAYSDEEEDFVDTIGKNLNEAKNVVGGWFDNVAKKLQGEADTIPKPTGKPYYQSGPIPPQKDYKSSHIGMSAYEPHYENNNEDLPKLPPRRTTTDKLYSAIGGNNSEDINVDKITLSDVTGDDVDNSKPSATNTKASASDASKKGNSNTKGNDKKWEKLTSVHPEPSNDFVVDDSDEEFLENNDGK
ncbi:ubiquitin-binding protein [Martiniozyma asiatica (nom. inval.)]|nr:ubiquitin-binding protein [Martiniozyma asiatica]